MRLTSEQSVYLDEKLRDLQGQVLGLRAILGAILVSNHDLKLDENKLGAVIQGWPVADNPLHHPDVQIKARELMHAVLSERLHPNHRD
jgi:regulator of replication initiation timing